MAHTSVGYNLFLYLCFAYVYKQISLENHALLIHF